MNVLVCKECGSEDDYDTDHRCNKCGGGVRVVKLPEGDNDEI